MATTQSSALTADDLRQQLLQMASGYLLSSCLHVAAKLNIADHVARGPRTIETLAADTNTQADALYRVLRALVSVGIFSEPQPRTIGLSPAARLLCSDQPGNVRGVVLWGAHPFLMHVSSDLLYSVTTGESAMEHLYGKPAFECMASMPEVNHDFNAGMTAMSVQRAPAILDAYDFSEIRTLMDVGGGHGYFICEALKRYPQMKGILLDQPGVVEAAKCTLYDMRLDDRCRPIGGSFFDHIPSGADAYFMQKVIHDWDDKSALKILGNARQALHANPKGRVIVVDAVLPEDARPHLGKLGDLLMLMGPGGRERTEAEWRSLFQKADFALTKIVPTKMADSVLEAVPNGA